MVTRSELSTDQESDVVIAPQPRGGGFNDADLRYVRRALWALRDAQQASDQAATWSTDTGVRAVARRARTMQADDIRELSSMLERWGRHEDGPEHTGALEPSSPPAFAGKCFSSLDSLELDRGLIESLIAHAGAAIASARTEMIEGFEPTIRRKAEHTIRVNNRALSALRPGTSARTRPDAPAAPAACLKHRA
jgi:uncharacterized protein (DUF305 family)